MLGFEVDSAALFSLREGIIDIDVSREQQDVAIMQTLDARSAYNARVPGSQPATPTAESCGWCPFVGRCDPAWDGLNSGEIERLGWGDAVRGVIRSPVTLTESGLAAMQLEAQFGTVRGLAAIIDVPAHEKL